MLTKHQKLCAYKFARARLRYQWGSEFICIQLGNWLEKEIILNRYPSDRQLKSTFPELYACQPPNLSSQHSWFDEPEDDLNRLLRIVLLDFCILQLN